MFQRQLIFSWWIWTITILYAFRFIPYSMIYSSFCALVFTSIVFLNNKKINIQKRIIIGLVELFFFVLNIYFHFKVDRFPLISVPVLLFNIGVFLLYLFVLYLYNESFYSIYFIRIPKTHYNKFNN